MGVAPTAPMGPLADGSISNLAYNISNYLCTNFGAFIKKCTIRPKMAAPLSHPESLFIFLSLTPLSLSFSLTPVSLSLSHTPATLSFSLSLFLSLSHSYLSVSHTCFLSLPLLTS